MSTIRLFWSKMGQKVACTRVKCLLFWTCTWIKRCWVVTGATPPSVTTKTPTNKLFPPPCLVRQPQGMGSAHQTTRCSLCSLSSRWFDLRSSLWEDSVTGQSSRNLSSRISLERHGKLCTNASCTPHRTQDRILLEGTSYSVPHKRTMSQLKVSFRRVQL